MTLTNPLPYDSSRCDPVTPSDKCQQCARWNNAPGQTWGHWTPCASFIDSNSKRCRYIEAIYAGD